MERPPPHPFIKAAGGGASWVCEIFEKMEGLDFSHKNGVVGKIEVGLFEKGGYHLFSYWVLYCSEGLMCVRVLYLHHFYQYYLFHRKNLVL